MQEPFPRATRFAPSPTGRLHLGHAYSALFAAQQAKAIGGSFLLRIEDIDIGRCRPEFEQGIYEDLAWLGLTWPRPGLRQSGRFGLYADFLHVLKDAGLIYPCFCSRKEIQAEIARAPSAPHGPDGPLYPGICRSLDKSETDDRIAAGEAHALRLNMAKAARLSGPLSFTDLDRGEIAVHPQSCGDVVLGRKDVPVSYHIAVTVDDALQNVALVTRGKDLLHTTHVHRVLQALLGLPEPQYRHHELITDAGGRRFAKRNVSMTLQTLRQSGNSPDDVKRQIGILA